MGLVKVELPINLLDGIFCPERMRVISERVGEKIFLTDWHIREIIGKITDASNHGYKIVSFDGKEHHLSYSDICELYDFT
ncbi:hypothetical protein GOV13_01355 [Candidatus Pacearchaeota archaeon]|nr:hypothetical protein [Candidatus Pacearchaeota archaeon]